MRIVQLTIWILVAGTFLAACSNTERLLQQAYTHSANQEWLQAAETLSYIPPERMAKIIFDGKDTSLDNFKATADSIMGSGDIEAIKIYNRWIEDVNIELGKMRNEDKICNTMQK